jgi:hypothetical protein
VACQLLLVGANYPPTSAFNKTINITCSTPRNLRVPFKVVGYSNYGERTRESRSPRTLPPSVRAGYPQPPPT